MENQTVTVVCPNHCVEVWSDLKDSLVCRLCEGTDEDAPTLNATLIPNEFHRLFVEAAMNASYQVGDQRFVGPPGNAMSIEMFVNITMNILTKNFVTEA